VRPAGFQHTKAAACTRSFCLISHDSLTVENDHMHLQNRDRHCRASFSGCHDGFKFTVLGPCKPRCEDGSHQGLKLWNDPAVDGEQRHTRAVMAGIP
jgi:hypothetical protein